MSRKKRWCVRVGLIVGALVCFGCNPAMLPFLLQGESRQPASVKALVDRKDKKKEVRVALLASSRLDSRQECLGADRLLCDLLARKVRALAEANGEKLLVVEPRKVEDYKSTHPGWEDREPAEVVQDLKRLLKADYVIDMEISSLSLYEPHSRELLRGRALVHVSLLNANNPDDEPPPTDVEVVYPGETAGGGIPVDLDTSWMQFRVKFLDVLAKRIAFCFCDHPTIRDMD